MLGFADVVTSIGAAFGDAVVGVGNLQPLLHLVSPDQALPTTLLSAPTSTMMSTIFKESSIGCYFARKQNATEQVHQTKVEIGDPRWWLLIRWLTQDDSDQGQSDSIRVLPQVLIRESGGGGGGPLFTNRNQLWPMCRTGGGEGRGGKAIKGFPQVMALRLDDKIQSKQFISSSLPAAPPPERCPNV